MKLITSSHSKVLAAVFAMATSTCLAQVKIGTNPTTIAPTSNLEVEASTAGRRTSIDKVTGQVTIKDGTEGAGRVFTSDANGGGSWKQTLLAGGKILATTRQTFPLQTNTQLITNTAMTITSPGNFLVSVRWWGVSHNTLNGQTSAYFKLLKNGTVVDEIEYYVTGANKNEVFSFTLNLLAPNCNTDDVLTLVVLPAIPNDTQTIWEIGTAGADSKWMPSILVSKI